MTAKGAFPTAAFRRPFPFGFFAFLGAVAAIVIFTLIVGHFVAHLTYTPILIKGGLEIIPIYPVTGLTYLII